MIERLVGDAVARAAAQAVRPRGDVSQTIARAAWSVVAEPGDQVAGALIAQVGAEVALESVTRGGRALRDIAAPDDDDRLGPAALTEGRRRWLPRLEQAAVTAALRGAADVGAVLVVPGDPEWPTMLDDLGPGAPIALWVRGRPEALIAVPRVAVVGARASSGYGEHVAGELSADLAAGGAVVVSGGAYGIDGAAHRAALGVGGTTVAFLAGGVDRAYPAGHLDLLRRIRDAGAVVSEPPCGAAPTKWRFLARNRLIAALAHATIVVEAGWRSGSLNTAAHAAELGRPLGAVPGPITSASSAGCHRLLREYDARCVTSAAEVRELWGEVASLRFEEPDDPETTRLLDALSSRAASTVLELGRRAGLDEESVRARLGLLELDGAVRRSGDGWIRIPSRRPMTR